MNELCPKCRILTELRIDSREVEKEDEKGKVQKVLVKDYFCTLCNMLIRREETVVMEDKS